MGLLEAIKQVERMEGRMEGMKELSKLTAKAKLEGKKEEKNKMVQYMIAKLNLPDAQIAEATETTLAFVRKMRLQLKK